MRAAIMIGPGTTNLGQGNQIRAGTQRVAAEVAQYLTREPDVTRDRTSGTTHPGTLRMALVR